MRVYDVQELVLDIALAFDEGYADHAQVTVESVLSEHGGSRPSFWLLMPREVVRTHGRAFQQQVAGRGRLHLLAASEAFRVLPAAELGDVGYLSNGMYLRLFLPALLPAAVERYLYLDVDTVCVGDLSELWRMPMGDHALAAVPDGYTGTVGAEGGLPGAEGLDPDAPYFNSGVLLVNKRRWRELRVSERCFDYLRRNRGRLRFPDQDALNVVAYGRWLPLDPQWNVMKLWRPRLGYEDLHWNCMGRIIHFAGRRKPWDVGPTGDPGGHRRDRYAVLARRARSYRESAPRER